MSTYVPETFRGQGVAAQLSQVRVKPFRHLRHQASHILDVLLCLMFLLQAAMDFLVEENLKAHVSCWYIKKYIEEHPQRHYEELVIT